MDRIKLYEAATGTEAMNEIKAACSNMRNCIRKYAGGKANAKVKNEMLEGMKKIEADLKAVVKSGAKPGKKINESNEYVTPSYVYAIWYLYDGTNFEVIWYAPESTDMTEQDAIDKFNDTCYEFAEVGPDDSLDLTLVKLPYTNRIWHMLALCSSYKNQHPRDNDPYYDDVIEPMRMELDNNMLKCIDTWNGESADGMYESASGRRMHGDKRKFGKKMNESAGGLDEDQAYEICCDRFFDNWLDCEVDPDDLEAAFRAGYNDEDMPTSYGDLYTGKEWDYYENAYSLGVTFSNFATVEDVVNYYAQ